MSTKKIFCGVCGFATETALFEHIREAHGLKPADYAAQCPGAPLYTAAFQEYLRNQGVHASDTPTAGSDAGAVRVMKELFGVKMSRPVAPLADVPTLDEQYHFDPALAQAVVRSLADNDRVMLVGPTGSGKSSLVMQLAARLGWPAARANLHGETSAADLLGQNKVRDGEVYFQYGLIPQAMKSGQLLILEEVDAADPGILFVLQGLLEEGGTLTLADNGAEVIHPHPDFRLLATANTLGTGDEHGLYAGTQVMNASFLDRWQTVFQVDYLPELEGIREVLAVIEDPEVRDLVTADVLTGARSAELFHLDWGSVNFETTFLYIQPREEDGGDDEDWGPKNADSVREVPIAGELMKILKRIRRERPNARDTDPVFLMPDGRPFYEYPNFAYRKLKKAINKANRLRRKESRGLIPMFNLRLLRHFFISWSLTRRDHPLSELELIHIVGHVDLAMFRKTYFHADLEGETGRRMRAATIYDQPATNVNADDDEGETDSEGEDPVEPMGYRIADVS